MGHGVSGGGPRCARNALAEEVGVRVTERMEVQPGHLGGGREFAEEGGDVVWRDGSPFLPGEHEIFFVAIGFECHAFGRSELPP